MNDVVIGAWKEGLNKTILADITTIEERYNRGFRQLPFESTVMELVLILNACDDIFEELMVGCMADGCECDECQCEEKVIILPEAKKPKTK